MKNLRERQLVKPNGFPIQRCTSARITGVGADGIVTMNIPNTEKEAYDQTFSPNQLEGFDAAFLYKYVRITKINSNKWNIKEISLDELYDNQSSENSFVATVTGINEMGHIFVTKLKEGKREVAFFAPPEIRTLVFGVLGHGGEEGTIAFDWQVDPEIPGTTKPTEYITVLPKNGPSEKVGIGHKLISGKILNIILK